MSLIILGVVLETSLAVGMTRLRRHRRVDRRRQELRFAAAAAEARRLAHNALIIEASLCELTELAIEQSLVEMGIDWSAEAI